jgi:hypothetical protein
MDCNNSAKCAWRPNQRVQQAELYRIDQLLIAWAQIGVCQQVPEFRAEPRPVKAANDCQLTSSPANQEFLRFLEPVDDAIRDTSTSFS